MNNEEFTIFISIIGALFSLYFLFLIKRYWNSSVFFLRIIFNFIFSEYLRVAWFAFAFCFAVLYKNNNESSKNTLLMLFIVLSCNLLFFELIEARKNWSKKIYIKIKSVSEIAANVYLVKKTKWVFTHTRGKFGRLLLNLILLISTVMAMLITLVFFHREWFVYFALPIITTSVLLIIVYLLNLLNSRDFSKNIKENLTQKDITFELQKMKNMYSMSNTKTEYEIIEKARRQLTWAKAFEENWQNFVSDVKRAAQLW